MKIIKPTLIVDEAKCKRNIDFMVDKAIETNVTLSPHFKTHQSRKIGGWFKEAGVTNITVSSLTMASYFADDGWTDITVAIPVNLLELDLIKSLIGKTSLTLLVTDVNTVHEINRAIEGPLALMIEIDCGYNRSGVLADDDTAINLLIEAISEGVHDFKGFYVHQGSTYNERGVDAINSNYFRFLSKSLELKHRYASHNVMLAIGDTPGCSVAEGFPGVSIISPGNFVFYDVTQSEIGSCNISQVAIVLACPIIFKNVDRRELVMYGGASHLSKDYVLIDGEKCFGKVVKLNADNTWSKPIEKAMVTAISQEHGTVRMNGVELEDFEVGDVIGILPAHACLSAHAMGEMYTCNGERLDHMQKSNNT